jgi:hypothetical protein
LQSYFVHPGAVAAGALSNRSALLTGGHAAASSISYGGTAAASGSCRAIRNRDPATLFDSIQVDRFLQDGRSFGS